MATELTLQTLSDQIAITQGELDDLRQDFSGFSTRLTTSEDDIVVLQNPPVGVPPALLSWFGLGHSITEADSILNSSITGINATLATHTTNIGTVTSDLASEVTNRGSADTTLQTGIDNLGTTVDTLNSTLTQEISDRGAMSSALATQLDALNTQVNNVSSSLAAETTTRGSETTALNSQVASINAAIQTVNTQITLLQNIGVDPLAAQASQITTLTTLANDASTAVAQEIIDRANADTSLQNAINSNGLAITGLSTSLTNESNSRIAADSAFTASLGVLQTTVNGHTASISAETAARISADSTLTTNVATNTTGIADNAAAIGTETSRATAAEGVLTGNVSANTANITTNTANILTNTGDITTIKSRFSVDKDGGGYVTGWRIIDQSAAAGAFNLRNLNNDARLQNPGYVGKYFPPVSVSAFAPPVSYTTQWGTAGASLFHGTDGNDYTRNVLVYSTLTVGLSGSVFKGVDFGAGGDLNRLGQVLTTFRVNFSGSVNRYLSLWYRIKTAPGDTTQRWFPVALADATMSGGRSYERVAKDAVVQISVTADQVVEFGLTVLNTLDSNIADVTKDFIYGGSVSVTALNMVTIS